MLQLDPDMECRGSEGVASPCGVSGIRNNIKPGTSKLILQETLQSFLIRTCVVLWIGHYTGSQSRGFCSIPSSATGLLCDLRLITSHPCAFIKTVSLSMDATESIRDSGAQQTLKIRCFLFSCLNIDLGGLFWRLKILAYISNQNSMNSEYQIIAPGL